MKLLSLILVSSIMLAILHIGAFVFYWYWTFWWFDILTHFVGGIIGSLLFLYLYLKRHRDFIGEKKLLLLSAIAVIGIGIIWEYFEIIIRSALTTEPDYYLDTFLDIMTDFAGGLFAYLLCLRFVFGKNEI